MISLLKGTAKRKVERARASLARFSRHLSTSGPPSDAAAFRLLSDLARAMQFAQLVQALGADAVKSADEVRGLARTPDDIREFNEVRDEVAAVLADQEAGLRRAVTEVETLAARKQPQPVSPVTEWCAARLRAWADEIATWCKELARPVELKVVLAARLEAITETGARVAFDEGPRLEVPFGAQGAEELRPLVGRPIFVSGSATFGPLGTVVSLREPRFAPEERPLDLDRGLWDFVAANAPQIDFGDDE